MSKIHELTNAITNLQKRFTEPEITAPIYVRFRTIEQNIIIPVSNLSYDTDGIIIDNYTMNWNDITSIEPLCDAKRSPVFLNNFDEENELDQTEEIYASSL